jgi:hypothetical protein
MLLPAVQGPAAWHRHVAGRRQQVALMLEARKEAVSCTMESARCRDACASRARVQAPGAGWVDEA